MSMLGESAQAAILDDVLVRIKRKIVENKRSRKTVAVLEQLQREVECIHPLYGPEGTRIAL